jgi:hypothetical protein
MSTSRDRAHPLACVCVTLALAVLSWWVEVALWLARPWTGGGL